MQFLFGYRGIPHDHDRIDRQLLPFLNFDRYIDAMIDFCVIAFDDSSFEAGVAIHGLDRPHVFVKGFRAEETRIQKLSFSNLHAHSNRFGAEMMIPFDRHGENFVLHTGLDRIVDLNGIVQRRRDQLLSDDAFEVAFLLHVPKNLDPAFFNQVLIDRALLEDGDQFPQFFLGNFESRRLDKRELAGLNHDIDIDRIR